MLRVFRGNTRGRKDDHKVDIHDLSLPKRRKKER